MKKTTLLLLLAATVGAQSNTLVIQQAPGQEKVRSSAQSAELTEASQLAASAVKLYNEGKYNEAYSIAKRALELREKKLNRDDELVTVAVLNLAEIQWARKKYEDSRNLFERVLHSYEHALGTENPRVSKILDRLALVYYALSQPAQAEKLYKQSLAIREKALGSEHSETTRSLYNLAEFYQFEGQYKQAEPLYKRLVEIRTKTGTDTASIAEATDRYACLLRKEKRTQEADHIEGQGLNIVYPGEDNSSFVNGGVVNGRALDLVAPRYPEEARANRVSGNVTVQILINESGKVIRACAIEGAKELMKASESAASRSRFSPTTVEGKPVKVNGVIIYRYVAN